jgi:CAAX protease family protein
VTKEKRPSVPAQTTSKVRSRSGNPAVRAGQVEPIVPSGKSPSVRRPPKPAPAPVDERGELPPDGAAYPQILRGESYLWWRSVLGAVFALSLFLLITTVVSQALVTVFWATTAGDRNYRDYFASAFAFELPLGMLAVNLGLATLIPIAWGLMAAVHHMRPGWLSSVQPRIRWRYLFLCLAIAAVVLNGMMLLSTAVGEPLSFHPQQGFWGFLAVILLTSPIQAAAEEIFFRGYLLQALGSLVAKPWFGVVVSSLVFALLHGTQNLPLFADRLAFGLLAALLVWRTGGLEAGIAAHVINNVFAYLIAGLTTSVAELKGISGIGWVDAAFDVGGFALFAVLAYGLSRLMKLRTHVQLTGAATVEKLSSSQKRGLGPKLGLQ